MLWSKGLTFVIFCRVKSVLGACGMDTKNSLLRVRDGDKKVK